MIREKQKIERKKEALRKDKNKLLVALYRMKDQKLVCQRAKKELGMDFIDPSQVVLVKTKNSVDNGGPLVEIIDDELISTTTIENNAKQGLALASSETSIGDEFFGEDETFIGSDMPVQGSACVESPTFMEGRTLAGGASEESSEFFEVGTTDRFLVRC